jgi:hypothetical protein
MKKPALLCSLFFLLSLFAGAQDQFPQSFVGTWKGELWWYRSGPAEPKKVPMQLIVQPADTAGQYTWQIVYGEKKEDNRPYLLKPVDTARGHWVVDEVNGIVLDQFWLGNRLTGAFTVAGNTLVNSYRIENGKMIVEFYSFPSKPIATTGGTSKDIPPVDSYAVRAYQRAVLSRE